MARWPGERLPRKGFELKQAFIQVHCKVWPTSVRCRVLGVSVAGYHEHFVRRAGAVRRRQPSDDALLVRIKAVHDRAADIGAQHLAPTPDHAQEGWRFCTLHRPNAQSHQGGLRQISPMP